MVVAGASVQSLAVHFVPVVGALHLPSDPILVKQSEPSAYAAVYVLHDANVATQPAPVDLQVD